MQLTRVLLLVLVLGHCSTLSGQTSQPHSVAAAKKVIDLSTFPLFEVDGDARSQSIATQSYVSKLNVTAAADKIQQELAKRGFKVLDGAMSTPAYATATFEKSGYLLSMMATPGPTDSSSSISLNNLGNVDLTKLPIPPAAKLTYGSKINCMYVSDQSVDATKTECQRLLEKDGWSWFGDTTVSFFVRKGAVRLQVMVSAAPAQGNQTMIQYSCEQLSTEIPVPDKLTSLQYADINGSMIMSSDEAQPDFVKSLRTVMEVSGWKATTDNPVKIGFHDHLIFRSADKELADCEIFEIDNRTECRLKYMTAAQVDAESEKAKQMAAANAAKKPEQTTAVTLPTLNGGKLEKESANQFEFSLPSGTAQKSLQQWLKQCSDSGWKSKALVDAKEAGEFELSKDNITLRVSLIDPGFIPGSITISAPKNCQLQLKK